MWKEWFSFVSWGRSWQEVKGWTEELNTVLKGYFSLMSWRFLLLTSCVYGLSSAANREGDYFPLSWLKMDRVKLALYFNLDRDNKSNEVQEFSDRKIRGHREIWSFRLLFSTGACDACVQNNLTFLNFWFWDLWDRRILEEGRGSQLF